MVKLDKIYTKGGDRGETSLGDGTRVVKHDRRVAAFGTVDEANAAIGLARLHTKGDVDKALAAIQNDLFDLGADLCTPGDDVDNEGNQRLRITKKQVKRLEKEIDAMIADLEPLRSFVLPGGNAAAAHLHMARTVVRRAERITCELAMTERVNRHAIKYLNRLSDLLFVMGRWLNDKGKADVLWEPGGNQ